jgi:hypothetical protein
MGLGCRVLGLGCVVSCRALGVGFRRQGRQQGGEGGHPGGGALVLTRFFRLPASLAVFAQGARTRRRASARR